MDYQYKKQVHTIESSIKRHLRKIWRKANAVEKGDPELANTLRKQYWNEYRSFKERYIGL